MSWSSAVDLCGDWYYLYSELYVDTIRGFQLEPACSLITRTPTNPEQSPLFADQKEILPKAEKQFSVQYYAYLVNHQKVC